MAHKERSLTKQADWQLIHRRGQQAYSPEMVLKYLKKVGRQSRFGIITSTKVSKKATKRNLVRRRLKAVVLDSWLEIKPGFDLVIIARPAIVNCNFQEIKCTFKNLLRRARLTK